MDFEAQGQQKCNWITSGWNKIFFSGDKNIKCYYIYNYNLPYIRQSNPKGKCYHKSNSSLTKLAF